MIYNYAIELSPYSTVPCNCMTALYGAILPVWSRCIPRDKYNNSCLLVSWELRVKIMPLIAFGKQSVNAISGYSGYNST